jgi:hypothetical protein
VLVVMVMVTAVVVGGTVGMRVTMAAAHGHQPRTAT